MTFEKYKLLTRVRLANYKQINVIINNCQHNTHSRLLSIERADWPKLFDMFEAHVANTRQRQLPVKSLCHEPFTRYMKLRVAHAPGKPGIFSPPPTSKETTSQRSRHASRHVRRARTVVHVGIANPRWRGKRSRHSRRMRNPQFYASGKRPAHGFAVLHTVLLLV